MKAMQSRHRQPFQAFRSLAGLLMVTALCATHSAWSQQPHIAVTQNAPSANTPRSSAQIRSDIRNGSAASNLAKNPIGNMRTPMEVTDGVATMIGHYPESSKVRIVIGLTPPKMAEEEAFLKELQAPSLRTSTSGLLPSNGTSVSRLRRKMSRRWSTGQRARA